MNKVDQFGRIRGTLYGVAVGDCLGASVEFMDARDIQRQIGTVTEIMPSWLDGTVGEGTDDTAMTLAVAEGIMKTGPLDDPVEKIGAEFVRWFRNGPVGCGNICYRAIAEASRGGKLSMPTRNRWFTAAEKVHRALNGRSGGNGTLMRTAPIGLLLKDSACDGLAYAASKMTHYDDDAALACIVYCEMIGDLIQGGSLREVLERLTAKTEYYPVTQDPKFVPFPTGYVKDSFKTALWGLCNERNLEDSLIAIVNLGGDSDTTAAIAGGLAGAAYGLSAIPPRWIAALDAGLTARLDACALAAAKVWDCEP